MYGTQPRDTSIIYFPPPKASLTYHICSQYLLVLQPLKIKRPLNKYINANISTNSVYEDKSSKKTENTKLENDYFNSWTYLFSLPITHNNYMGCKS